MNTNINKLKLKGWSVKPATVKRCLPQELRSRFQDLPKRIETTLFELDECIAPDGASWFLCGLDYLGKSNSIFTWNEFESESLMFTDEDEEWESHIKDFWDSHFPIYISIRDGYEFAAFSLSKNTFGKIVIGKEPDYENTEIVADSFDQFVKQLN